jgi:hypothetical protein
LTTPNYVPVDADRTTALLADQADTYYQITADIVTTGTAIDASAVVVGRSFDLIDGTIRSDDGPAFVVGAGLAESQTWFKISEKSHFLSGGAGLFAASGGVDVENVGEVETVATAFEFNGDNNTLINTSADIEVGDGSESLIEHFAGTIRSTGGTAILSAGDNDNITNTGLGVSITAEGDAIVMNGMDVALYNEDGATIQSLSGSAVVFAQKAYMRSTSTITASADAVLAGGANTTFLLTGAGAIQAQSGRGIVSTAAKFTLTTESELATITAASDALSLSGNNATITNNSAIVSTGAAGINASGKSAIITNGRNIEGATYGILSTGDSAVITNGGDILSDGIGIGVFGNKSIVTSNLHVTADVALAIGGRGTVFTNANEIRGESATAATIAITASGKTTIINKGAIHAASGDAIEAGTGRDIVRNTGSIFGDVALGGGNDVFSALKGEVTGVVAGGSGDDVYITGIALAIREKAGGGIDTVQSKFTYTLGANVENLQLLGNGTMDATGNKLANILTGNSGDNHLTGRGGRDIFVFTTGFGHDIVTDFTDRQDRLDMSDYKGISKFSDLAGKIAQSGDDVVITLSRHDRLTLDHVDVADLSAADFLF